MMDIDRSKVTSVALKRIIDEVARDSDERTRYNRTYHRHNRS
jgi:hypothetical protein